MLCMTRWHVWQYVTVADKIVISVLIIVSLAGLPVVYYFRQVGEEVAIEVDGSLYRVVSLTQDQQIAVPGPLGTTLVIVQDHAVSVKSSPCRAKICVRTGEISAMGQLIVCVPNKVVIRIIGESTAPEYDAVTR